MEKKCKYCAMMIPKEAKICPHCRKKQKRSGLFLVLVILFFFIMIVVMVTSINSPTGGNVTTSSGKDFFFKCLDAYPDDAQICVKGELTRNSFDTVESWLKQYVASHPQAGKKKKK